MYLTSHIYSEVQASSGRKTVRGKWGAIAKIQLILNGATLLF